LDERRPGRRCKVDDELAKEAAAIYMEGWEDRVHHQRKGYCSVADAISKNQEFAVLAERADCCPAMLLAAMRRMSPALGKMTQRVKPQLSAKLMLQRRRVCGQLLRLPARARMAAEFFDEASWGFSNLDRKVWGNTTLGREWLVTDNRCPRQHSDKAILHFCVTVNYAVGPHTITFITGTKGMRGHTPFKVKGEGGAHLG